METRALSVDLLQRIADYLSARPWIEVNAMLVEMNKQIQAQQQPGAAAAEAS